MIPPNPCGGPYEGEVFVDTAGTYVGDMTGPYKGASIQSGFTSGMWYAYGDGDICCGGIRFWNSPYWKPPWMVDECGGVDNFVPVRLASGWVGVLHPELVYDVQRRPG